jgi:hypothetical protein
MSFFPSEGNGGIFAQGAFTIDPNSTPEMIQAKRAQLAALMPQYGRAKYVGEGIGQLATGIATGRKNKALDKFEGERRQEAAGAFNNLMTGRGSATPRSSGPLNILGIAPQEQPATPEQGIADDAMKAIGKPTQGGNREAFIEQMMPHAMRVSQETGLDPRIIIAQAAQETGWGKSAPGNNYFGIKSHGKSGGNTFATNEVIDGKTVRINDSFRGYEGMGDSVDGYAQFLQENPRYREMLSAGDLDGQLAALGKSGYATDPNYAQSVGSIARSIQVPTQGGSFAPGAGTQVAQAGGPALNDLMMAAQNPWLTPQQKSVINSQIEQVQRQQTRAQDRQWAQQDPLYQLRLQQAQLDLEQDRAGTGANMPSAVQELQWRAQQAGLEPGTAEYQTFILNGSGDPSTFRALDMQAQAAGFEPGTPEYANFMATRGSGLQAGASQTAKNNANIQTGGQAAAAVAAGTATGKANAEAAIAADSDMQAGANALDLIQSIRNDPARKIGTGKTAMLGAIPGTAAYDFKLKVDQAKSGAFMTAIQQMRGMGALSNAEGQTATAAVTRMNTSMTEEGFLAALDDYEKVIRQGIAKAARNGGSIAGPAPSAPNTFSQMDLSELNQVDIGGLDAAGMDAWEARMQELGY